jgi:hypothetical protein
MLLISDAASVSCRYLMDVGSGRLPLRSIADNSIGDRLEVEIHKPGEVQPLLAALKNNHTLRSFVIIKMEDTDILRVRRSHSPVLCFKEFCPLCLSMCLSGLG